MAERIPREVVPSVDPAAASAARVAREFHGLLDAGAKLHVAGKARRDPRSLLRRGYTPKHRIDLFGTRFYLSNVRQNPELRFYVAWIVPPQATTTELSSYGVRTIDVIAADDAFLAGWEYHYFDPDLDPPGWYSQIPEGYVGRPCPLDPNKADASPWLDALPVVREFRRKVLRR